MAVRGEEVATSIEAHVRESIDRLVNEIRSSIEDVREVVNSQLKAALQSVQADVNSITFLPHIQKSIADLEESMTPPEPEPQAAPVPSGMDASRVKRAVQAVERHKSQVDVLNAMLEECLHFGSRATLLILRGETFSGWKGVGFTAAGGNDEMVKRFNAAPGLIPELDRVLREERVVIWDGANLSTRLGVPASSKAILVPMVIKDKVAAAVYVDAVEADAAKLDPASLELLVFTTGLIIDTVALRKKTPSPSLTDDGDTAAAAPARAATPAAPPAAATPPPAPPPAAPSRPATLSGFTPVPKPAAPVAPPPPVPPSPPQASDTVSFSASQIRDMMGAAQAAPAKFNVPSAEEFASPSPQPRPAPPPPPPPPAAPAPPPAAAAPSVGGDERPSTQYIPPAGVGRGGASSSPQNEDAKKHDEARRFARLLVSEIKLYNESKVDQGRKNRDLYERLKEDIDRSRQMYDERIADDVRKTSNYFYDELVRILADGNAESLGL
jgi:hypothetical protein